MNYSKKKNLFCRLSGSVSFILLFIFFVVLFSACPARDSTKKDNTIPANYWESFAQQKKQSVLERNDIPKVIIEYYSGLVKLSDDERSFKLLELLSAPFDDDTRALYLFLFCNICKTSDGALSDVLGDYCQKVIALNPEYTLAYLSYDQDLFCYFTDYLSYEFFINELNESEIRFAEFEKRLNTTRFSDRRAIKVRQDLLQSILEEKDRITD